MMRQFAEDRGIYGVHVIVSAGTARIWSMRASGEGVVLLIDIIILKP
jgi:hypothetical protein